MRGEFRISDRGLRGLIGWALVAATMIVPSWATTVKKMDLPELVQEAQIIVQGRVDQVYSQWNAERKLAFTYVSVTVEDPLKGERRRSVLIRQLGGRIGSLNQSVAGMPAFRQGDQVIVFLAPGTEGTFQVVGLNQGKYEILDDFAVSNVSGVSVFDAKTGQMSDAGFVSKAPLEAFKARIRELVR